jgi:hypothetical protein
MNRVLQVLVALSGLLFLGIGLRWLIDPASAAAQLGMPLLDGVGRSTQVGDMMGFFITLGSTILIALITAKRTWYYPGIMLLALAAVGRLLAWSMHDAALAADMIATEVVISSLLFFASRKLADKE